MAKAKTPKTLLYGFGPYNGYKENVTEQILSSLSPSPNLPTHVFDVRFSRSMFLKAFNHASPDIIIGLGQHPRARKLRIERRAINLWANKGEELQHISKTGPEKCFATLKLPQTSQTALSYDAGIYVCNFSMYLACEYCALKGARFGFIHIPKGFNPANAAEYLKKALKKASIFVQY